MRRALVILAIVIVVLGIGVWAYVTFVTPSASVSVSNNPRTGVLPTAGNVAISSTTESTATINEAQNPPTPTKVAQRLVEITQNIVSEGELARDILTSSTTSDVAVSFIDRKSGNIYQYMVGTGTLTRTSNRTIPGIQEAKWIPSGTIAFARYLSGDNHDLINTYALPANGAGGYFLAQNIADMAVSSTSILVLASNQSGSSASTERPDGSQAHVAFSTPLGEIRVDFLGKTQYLAFTKPSATLAGYAWLVNVSGNFEQIAGPLTGLVALPSPKGNWVFISYSSGGIMKTLLVNMTTRTSIDLPLGTIADKCVWTADESALYCGVPADPSTAYAYPDDWYQGAISFSDRIWKISVAGRYAELTLDFAAQAKQTLDATALAIDPAGKLLVFRNKIDGSLWSYEL